MSDRLVLASRSAVRLKLMSDAGVSFDADAADLDEDALVRGVSDPATRALMLARAKALHVEKRHPGRFVLGGDQVGVNDDGLDLEKPRDVEHHVRLLLSMAGRTHQFFPAVALAKDGVIVDEVCDRVAVRFVAFDEACARAYVQTGEGQGSCGGYESEHRGAQLIASVDGNLQAVLGFPLLLVLPMLRRHCAAAAGLLPLPVGP
jgi:septum formation protein